MTEIYTLVPFNLEEYLKNRYEVVTVCGNKAKILATDAKLHNGFNIVALVQCSGSDDEFVGYYNKYGRKDENKTSDYDLMMKVVVKKCYALMHVDNNLFHCSLYDRLFETAEDAHEYIEQQKFKNAVIVELDITRSKYQDESDK